MNLRQPAPSLARTVQPASQELRDCEWLKVASKEDRGGHDKASDRKRPKPGALRTCAAEGAESDDSGSSGVRKVLVISMSWRLIYVAVGLVDNRALYWIPQRQFREIRLPGPRPGIIHQLPIKASRRSWFNDVQRASAVQRRP
jgi:hypothetical protein